MKMPSTPKLRILMIASRYPPFAGGTETHVREVSARLAAAGHSVTVLTADPSKTLPRSEVSDGVAIRRVPAWPRRRDYMFAPRVLAEIRRGDWDVAHVQGYHTLFAPLAVLALWLARIPFALTFHSGGHSAWFRRAVRHVQYLLLSPLVRQ